MNVSVKLKLMVHTNHTCFATLIAEKERVCVGVGGGGVRIIKHCHIKCLVTFL